MTLPGKVILAPMADFTELPFRLLCNAEASLVPLVNATGIARNGDLGRVRVSDKENAGLQMFGINPDDFNAAARLVRDERDIGWIDINCGCPSHRTIAVGAGSRMLKKPKMVGEMVSKIKKNDFLVSVKMRLLPRIEDTLDFCREVENAGADFITVHGRTEEQGYSRGADWESIKAIHESIGIPVVGNGDVQTVDEGKERLKGDYADGFMIGRAALSNPGVFEGKEIENIVEAKDMVWKYLRICEEHAYQEISNIRTVSIQFFRGFRGCTEARKSLSEARNIEDIKVFLQ